MNSRITFASFAAAALAFVLTFDPAESIFFTAGTAVTLTIPAVTGGTAAALALGGLGALKLGLLAGAALASRRGGGRGKSRGRGKGHRGRRDTQDEDEIDVESVTKLLEPSVLGETSDGLVVDLEPTFRNLEVVDKFDCAKVLVCKVFTVDPSALSEDEHSLRSLFETQVEINLASAMSSYQLAARLGQVTGDASACVRRFSKCGHDFSKDAILKNFV